MITLSSLHHTLLSDIIEFGYVSDNVQLAKRYSCSIEQVESALHKLQDYHGVVLHPNEPKVWVIHPFSLAPTNFYVESQGKAWWGNCAWCSLGIAALLKSDLTITTTLGAQTQQVVIQIKNGNIVNTDFVVHFPIAMQTAWENVIFTCSNMLLFRSENEVDIWCSNHNMPKGDVQPIEKIWHFSKDWYGNHLDQNWKKWTIIEAKSIFAKHQLVHPVWQLDQSNERF